MNQESSLIIRQMELGALQNFTYFIGDKTTKEIAIIDPAGDFEYLCQQAESENLRIEGILLTHGHFDHVSGLEELLSMYDVPVYISTHESAILKPKCKKLSPIKDHEKIKLGNIDVECILTPGHSPGCQCFLSKGHLFSGDTLFIDGCGRCDLPGGDAKNMYNSLYNIIMKLPEETVIYPGHNYGHVEKDTLANQKKTNPYLQCHSLEEFLKQRMGILI